MRKGLYIDSVTNDLAVNKTRVRGYIQGLQIAETDSQNIWAIATSAKGEFKNNPLLGVGAAKYINSVGKEREFIREAKVQLEFDGYTAVDVKLKDGQLIIT